jgi:fatty acid synthase subunit alpha
MQHAVEHDKQGRLSYAMCAVNPSRVGKSFNDVALCEIVNTTLNGRSYLLEVGNFNVEVRRLFFMSLHGC